MAEPGFGVFWGGESTREDRDRASTPQSASRSARSVTSARRLPPIPSQTPGRPPALRSPTQQPDASDASVAPDSTPAALVDVLHTLLASIRRDSGRFMQDAFSASSRASPHERAVGEASSPSLPHRFLPPPPGVQAEDPAFFKREQALAADREAFFASTTLARKRHCALDDLQTYHFDRSSPTPKTGTRRRHRPSRRSSSGQGDALGMSRGAAAIERQRRKEEHLIHVLQTEIAAETHRAIKLVAIQPPPGRPLSRQKQHTLAAVVKERCEAADRVMRMLEDYRIVVGADAAKYLQATIAASKAVCS